MATTSIDVEEFWDDLLAYVESGPVIPVVGPELLTVEVDGVTTPLYRRVADRLLAKYGITGAVAEAALRPHHELTDAVAVLATEGRRIRDLYRPVHDILQEEIARNPEPPRALSQLAEISHFRLFATTTPDDLLARALNAVRYGGAPHTDEIPYAPNLPNERRRDLPELVTSSYSAVFYLFGRAEVSPFYAIHEEDALEFPYMLQQGNGPERVFAQLRSRHLLFIGCNFASGRAGSSSACPVRSGSFPTSGASGSFSSAATTSERNRSRCSFGDSAVTRGGSAPGLRISWTSCTGGGSCGIRPRFPRSQAPSPVQCRALLPRP